MVAKNYQWITEAKIPEGTPTRSYYGPHLWAALKCLDDGYENNAASWIWRDEAELHRDFKPVAGSLRSIENGIEYVDLADINYEGVDGDGI